MASEKPKFVIGSRESQLAMWQAKHAKVLFENNFGKDFNFEILGMTTLGDQEQNISLSQFSDKGIFTKELDMALLHNSIDCAVHCVKDLPTTLPNGLKIGCYLKRGKRNDCIIMDSSRIPKTLIENNSNNDNNNNNNNTECNNTNILNKNMELPNDFHIGTSSLRRRALLQNNFENIKLSDCRGNLNTRLKKLIELKFYDAIVLAQIGIERLEWDKYSVKLSNIKQQLCKDSSSIISERKDVDLGMSNNEKNSENSENSENNNENTESKEESEKERKIRLSLEHAKQACILTIDEKIMPYCVGQGGLAIACRENDDKMLNLLNKLNDIYCNISCVMERTLLYELQGGCKIPIGCIAKVLKQCNYCKLWNYVDNYFNSNISNTDNNDNNNNDNYNKRKCQACCRLLGLKLKSSNNRNDNNRTMLQLFQLRLYGIVLTQDGQHKVDYDTYMNIEFNYYDLYENKCKLLLDNSIKIGQNVANNLLQQGAGKIIQDIKQDAIKSAAKTKVIHDTNTTASASASDTAAVTTQQK